jgi:hypothetical protein
MTGRRVPYPYGTIGFTRDCVDRDRRRWPYATLLSDQYGHLIYQANHANEASLQMDVRASVSRIKEGEPNLGGQIPTSISVDGVPETVWRKWIDDDTA